MIIKKIDFTQCPNFESCQKTNKFIEEKEMEEKKRISLSKLDDYVEKWRTCCWVESVCHKHGLRNKLEETKPVGYPEYYPFISPYIIMIRKEPTYCKYSKEDKINLRKLDNDELDKLIKIFECFFVDYEVDMNVTIKCRTTT